MSFPHEFLDSNPIPRSDSDFTGNDKGPTNYELPDATGTYIHTYMWRTMKFSVAASVIHCDREKTAKETWVRVDI
jgi:hypothetical protein